MDIEVEVRRVNLTALAGWFAVVVGAVVMALQYLWPSAPGYVCGAVGLTGGWLVVSNAGPLIQVKRAVVSTTDGRIKPRR